LLFAGLAAVPAACQPAAAPVALERSPAGLDQVTLTVTSGHAQHRFIVEVARTEAEQMTGLMNRDTLAPDRGMIFPYATPQPVSFWMKNTIIPLDMIFVAPGGHILRIEAKAVPFSFEPVPSGGPIEAVLELGGGRAAELGIKPGDRVSWPH
jgi:uncharacterized membrane protein (UPF0127 family)